MRRLLNYLMTAASCFLNLLSQPAVPSAHLLLFLPLFPAQRQINNDPTLYVFLTFVLKDKSNSSALNRPFKGAFFFYVLGLCSLWCWPEGWVWRLPLHDSKDAGEETLLPITHEASVCVDQSFHLRDVSLHGYGTQFIQLLAIQQEVFVPEKQAKCLKTTHNNQTLS